MHKILILHGPNLNLLGSREPEIYGRVSLDEIDSGLAELGAELGVAVRSEQSNSEGELINHLHGARGWASGVVFNPGGYSHSSVALRDAISAIEIPVVEVHLSNIHARERFRHKSLLSGACAGVVAGFGPRSYALALQGLLSLIQ